MLRQQHQEEARWTRYCVVPPCTAVCTLSNACPPPASLVAAGLTNTQDVSKRKSDAAEAAGATDQQDKPADDTKGSSISSGGGDGVLSFVYSAGGGAGEDSQDEAMVVDVQG